MRTRMLFAAFVAALLAGPVAAVAQQTPVRKISNITGQLYLAQNNVHNTVFLVTSEGIILSDPLNREFALWLKGELAKRFNVPVRYVLYTHYHGDHASGGIVFADTAQFVGQRNMLVALAPPAGNPELPAAMSKMDVNKDGVLARSEVTGRVADHFDLYDYDRDGVINGAEMARAVLGDPTGDVYPPTITFTKEYTVTLGGKRVVMHAIGPAHSADLAVLHFPEEQAVFNADVFQIRRLPLAGLEPSIGAWIDALRFIDSLAYKYALTGHEFWGTKAEAREYLGYFTALAQGVAAGISAGRNLAEIQATLTLDAYKGYKRWDTARPAEIAEVYAAIMGTAAKAAAR